MFRMNTLIPMAAEPLTELRDLLSDIECDMQPALQSLPSTLGGFTVDESNHLNEYFLRRVHGEYALAFDRLRAACSVALSAESPDAHFVLCRSALEPLGRIFWLLEPGTTLAQIYVKVLRWRSTDKRSDNKGYRKEFKRKARQQDVDSVQNEIDCDTAFGDKLRSHMDDEQYVATEQPSLGKLVAALATPNAPEDYSLYGYLSKKAHSNPGFVNWGWRDPDHVDNVFRHMKRPQPTIDQVLMLPMLTAGAMFEVSRRSYDYLRFVRPDPNTLDKLASDMQETIKRHAKDQAWII